MTVIASKYSRVENDLYETEPWVVKALLRQIYIPAFSTIWEPAAGNHSIVRTLKDELLNPTIVSSDIVNYSEPHSFISDFFEERNDNWDGPFNVDWIITNPPYGAGNRMAVKFAELALSRADNVALLLTGKFDFGKTRTHLFRDCGRFYTKIGLLDRISFFDGKTGTEDHAWYVWTRQERRNALLNWEGKAVNKGKRGRKKRRRISTGDV